MSKFRASETCTISLPSDGKAATASLSTSILGMLFTQLRSPAGRTAMFILKT